MSVTNIVDSILEEANAKAEEIAKECEAEIAKIDSEQSVLINNKEEEQSSLYEGKIKSALDKAESMATLEWKNKLLKAKREILNWVFNKAKQKLASLPGDKYEQILTSLLWKINEDSWNLTAAKWESSLLAWIVSKWSKNFSIAWEWDFQWWFRLQTKITDYDYSFDNLFDALKKEKEFEIANKIFN